MQLPLTNHSDREWNNEVVNLFEGRFPFKYGASYGFYIKGGSMQKIIHEIKYHNNQELAIFIGELSGRKFNDTKMFSEIDFLVPIPLHKKRLKERGYNQAELIAKGISNVTQIRVCSDNIKRIVYNVSQTKNSKYQRWSNVADIFKIVDNNLFKGKHILLIDDVITTGSTIESCVKTIIQEEKIKISIFSIAVSI